MSIDYDLENKVCDADDCEQKATTAIYFITEEKQVAVRLCGFHYAEILNAARQRGLTVIR